MSTSAQIAPERTNTSPLLVSSQSAEFRRRVGSISRHSAVFFAGTLFTALAGYFFKIYLARTLGAEALGLYALGISIVSVISLFNAAGLPTAGARFVAEYSSQCDYARLGAFLRGGISFLGFGNLVLGAILLVVGPWVAVHFYHAPVLASYSWSFTAIMLLGVLNAFLGQCMAGFRAVAQRTAITHFAGTGALILFAVVLISLHFGLGGYLAAQVVSATLVLVCLAYSVWKLTPPAARVTGGFGYIEPRVMAFSATTFAIAVVHFVLGQADKITLGYYLDVKQVGIYSVSTAVAGFIPIALTSVNQVFSPMISELHIMGNREVLGKLYVFLTKWVLILTVPLAATVIMFPGPLMSIFGAGFRTGAAVLVVCGMSELINCAVGSVGFLLLMSGHQVTLMKIQAVNAAVMVALNILFVPRLGILGAALGLSVSVAGTNLWALAEVRKKLRLYPYNRSYLKLVVPLVLMLTALVVERSIWSHGSWRAAGSALILAYAIFLGTVALEGLEAEDRTLARTAWRKIWGPVDGDSNEQYA